MRSTTANGVPVVGDVRTSLGTLNDATIAEAIEWALKAVNERVAAEIQSAEQGRDSGTSDVSLQGWAPSLEDVLDRHPFNMNELVTWVDGGNGHEVGPGEIWVWLSHWTKIVIDTEAD